MVDGIFTRSRSGASKSKIETNNRMRLAIQSFELQGDLAMRSVSMVVLVVIILELFST